MRQDAPVQVPQLRTRVDADFVGEHPADPVICRQRLTLTTAAVESKEEQLP
jgi:hypothetical protein